MEDLNIMEDLKSTAPSLPKRRSFPGELAVAHVVQLFFPWANWSPPFASSPRPSSKEAHRPVDA